MNNEERLAKELGVFFRKLKKEVLNALEEYWSDYQMLQGHINLICAPVHEAHKEYYEILEKYIRKEYKLGWAEAERLADIKGVRYAWKEVITMPIAGFIKRDNDLFATIPKAEQDLLNRTYKTSEQTLSRVDGQINQIITDGYRSGKGINDIGNQLTKRFDQLSTWEARRIARTEVNTSHNKATYDAYQDMGVEYTQWIAALDDRTRDSHAEVDGEIIPLGGKYSNGLGYPGDMSGPIEEWINCRCSNAPFVVPYGYLAPSFSPFREEDLVPIEDIRDFNELIQNAMNESNLPFEPNNNLLEGNYKEVYKDVDDAGHTVTVYKYDNIELAFNENASITHKELRDHINSLPKIFETTNAKRIYIHDYNHPDYGGVWRPNQKTLHVNVPKTSKENQLNVFNHEFAHSIDMPRQKGHDWEYILSHPKIYEKIFKADNKLGYKNMGIIEPEIPIKFPTNYAGRSYLKFGKREYTQERIYSEDFADSSARYLNPHTHDWFVREFPNRAKYLESLYGKPDFKHSIFNKLSKSDRITQREAKFKRVTKDDVKSWQVDSLEVREKEIRKERDSIQDKIEQTRQDLREFRRSFDRWASEEAESEYKIRRSEYKIEIKRLETLENELWDKQMKLMNKRHELMK